MRFKLLVVDSRGDPVAHAVGSSTWDTLCGAGVDLRLDLVGERWFQADDANLIECPRCRFVVERAA